MTETPLAEIPRFAVIGRVNKGKSSILATLVEESDNRKIRISSTPGETTQCQVIPLVLGGETLLEFIDTPGFNRARQALDWLQRKHQRHPERPRLDTLRDFVAQHQGKRKFEDECLLLTPVLDGAGILYVVDSSKPFRADFLAEMEILRWTGRPRLALLNHISAESDFSEEWRQHLGETFNLTREFNAHQARFKERIRLITSLL
ncbi:MAG: GTPase domain-containing protein, partial [Verrucomicrobiota bacterium]